MKIIHAIAVFLLSISLWAQEATYLNTTDIKVTQTGNLVLAHSNTKKVEIRTPNGTLVKQFSFLDMPTGIAIQENYLFVTTSNFKGTLHQIDMVSGATLASIPLGMGARSPVISKDGSKVYVCNQWRDFVTEVNLHTKKVRTVATPREPYNCVLSIDGRTLYVSNFLPDGRADLKVVNSKVTVIELSSFTPQKQISLINGSNALRGMCISPDGNYIFITHNLGRFQVPTSQLQQGWMNTNAVSVISTHDAEFLGAFLTDLPERGTAGIWDIKVNEEKMFITHSGTHELSIIDYSAAIQKFTNTLDKEVLSYDLRFLNGLREIVTVPGNGPRMMAIDSNKIFINTYFSDALQIFDLSKKSFETVALNPEYTESLERSGERIFNDAANCFQGWQSCNGCHPGEGRVDGLNWDLLNDGIGNPKNCKSLLFSHVTAPAMITGIRSDAETAVRAGFKHIQFSEISEVDAKAVDAYLKSLKPLPSPWTEEGQLSKKAEKGKEVFAALGCIHCHNGPYFTDMQQHKIGETEFEAGWDTPSLREVWRTAPYLYDGRAGTLEELLQIEKHGLHKSKLKQPELEALLEYIKSL